MKKEEIGALIEKVANRLGYMDEANSIDPKDVYHWEWHQGVGLYGMYRYYQETGKREILDGIIHWYEKNIQDGLPAKNVNSTCPLYTLTYIYEETGEEKYWSLCEEWAEWVMHGLAKTEEGIFQHTVKNGENKEQVWDDTLFMAVLFLARMGVMKKKPQYIEETVYQFLAHLKYLTDTKTGLLFHGWTFDGRHNFSRARWARGNCWLTAVIVDYLDIIPDLQPGVKRFLLEALRGQVRALEACQRADGMWHTLLDDPTSYVETSATAGFGYGILKGVRKGYLPEAYEETGLRAVQAVIDHIAENGDVTQVSYGTGMGATLQDYRDIPIRLQPFGQALTVMLLSEYMLDFHHKGD